MKTHYTPVNTEKIDFYYQNEALIKKARAFTTSILMYLKKDAGIIGGYTVGPERSFVVQNKIAIGYNLTLPMIDSTIALVFYVRLQKPQSLSSIGILQSFYDGSITVDTYLWNPTELSKNIAKEIDTYIYGITNEVIFLDDFLVPFKEKFHEQVSYVHYAGKNKDYTKGVDFIIRFKPLPALNDFDIEFNLKSSKKYLDQHKMKYPKVSTFIF